MKTDFTQLTYFEKILIWIKKVFPKYKFAFFSAMLFGGLTYVFAFTNKLINHDEVISMFAKGSGLSSGRWALDLMHYIFPDFSMPWIYGVISVFLISLAACIIVGIYDIKNTFVKILLSGLIISFPSMIGTFAYMFTASSYAFAFFLAVLSALLFTKRSWLCRISAAVLLIFSIGIYQSYIAVTASLLLIVLLQKALYQNEKAGNLIKESLIYLAGLIISVVVYYVVLQILLHVNNVELNSYANANMSGDSSIIKKLLDAYHAFFTEIVERRYCLIPTRSSRLVHVALFLFSGIAFLFVWARVKIFNKLFSLLILALIPLSINCMFLISSKNSIHTLVLYSFIAVYVLFSLIVDNISLSDENIGKAKKGCLRVIKEVAAWGMAFIVITNVYMGNTVYLRMYLYYENIYGFYSSVVTQVKSTPGFDASSKIALVGNAGNSLHFHSAFNDISTEITGTAGINVNSYTRKEFIINFVGTEIPFANDYEVEEVKKTSEFKEMPIYPYYGSIKKIGDFVVVKFQE